MGQGLPRPYPGPLGRAVGIDRLYACHAHVLRVASLSGVMPCVLRTAAAGDRALPRPGSGLLGRAPRRPRGSIPGSVYPICRKRDTCSTSRRPADALIGGPSLQIMAQRRAVHPAHPGRPLPLPPAVGVAARCIWERPLLFRYHITGIWQNQGRGGRTAARRIFAQKERGASPSCFLQAIYFAAASALPNSWPL